MKKWLAILLLSAGFASSAMAADMKTEAYAHPTLFGSQAQVNVDTKSVYITGSKYQKSTNQIAIDKKCNVLVESWVKDVLSLIKDQSRNANFNPKLPVLRSELAIIIAEGFDLKTDKNVHKSYTDVPESYWASEWIYKTTKDGIMIGYPDNSFKPDQPITKAEVFATVAQMIAVPIDRSLVIPEFKGNEIKYIPMWAIAATKEVVASQLLEQVPNPQKVNNDEYLSKEQVAYIIGWLRNSLGYSKSIAADPNTPDSIRNYNPTCVDIKLSSRLSAKHSNIGDKFSAKTVKDVAIGGHTFAAGSVVNGEVVEVKRPGFKNPGFVKVKFLNITDKNACAEFPKNISNAQATKIKSPNVIARLIGAPFSASARIVGVVGRSAGTGIDVIGNGLEEFGDRLSNGTVEILSLKPVRGVKDYGWSIVTLGKGVYDICKLAVSGTFGVIYEITDEIKYVILPSASNDSSLNPNEEMVIIF